MKELLITNINGLTNGQWGHEDVFAVICAGIVQKMETLSDDNESERCQVVWFEHLAKISNLIESYKEKDNYSGIDDISDKVKQMNGPEVLKNAFKDVKSAFNIDKMIFELGMTTIPMELEMQKEEINNNFNARGYFEKMQFKKSDDISILEITV